MNRLISALLALPLSWSVGEPLFAGTTYQPGYPTSSQCFRDEYREEYVPGTQDKPGHVRNWTERLKSRAVQILLLACPLSLNIHRRLQQLMTTAVSKAAFLVDFSVMLQELLYRGGTTHWRSSGSNDWLPS